VETGVDKKTLFENKNSNKKTSASGAGKKTLFGNKNSNKKTSVASGAGKKTSFGNKNSNKKTSVASGAGKKTLFENKNSNKKTSASGADKKTSFENKNSNKKTSVASGADKKTLFENKNSNKKTSVASGADKKTSFGNKNSNKKTSVASGAGKKTLFENKNSNKKTSVASGVVAIVILNWNGRTFLERFFGKVSDSVLSSGVSGVRLIVADNGSTDDSVEWMIANFPDTELILLDKNYGFADGYNKALERITAKYFVLLNSDIEVTDNWLSPLIDYMDNNPEVAACAPKLRSFNNRDCFEYAGAGGGFIDKYGYIFCRGRILDSIETDRGQYDGQINVFWATGAALMVRSELFHRAGGLDGSFFAHMEEIDLCWRLQLIGYKIANVPESVVYHVGGGALPNNSPRKLYLNYRNNLLMMAKNLQRNRWQIIFVRLLMDAASGLVYLLSGKLSYFNAVIMAHWAFFGRIPDCRKKRKAFRPLIVKQADTGIYNGSIVCKYFGSGKKITFSCLKMKGL
jgi:GT2 family glycosyltransferase